MAGLCKGTGMIFMSEKTNRRLSVEGRWIVTVITILKKKNRFINGFKRIFKAASTEKMIAAGLEFACKNGAALKISSCFENRWTCRLSQTCRMSKTSGAFYESP